jgi:hypothetical protein
MRDRLVAALDGLQRASDLVDATLLSLYPPGSSIVWRRGERRLNGIVTMHGYRGRIKVKNTRSGKESWTEAASIVRG